MAPPRPDGRPAQDAASVAARSRFPTGSHADWRLPGLGLLSGTVIGIRQDGRPADKDDLFFGINVAGASLPGQHGREVTIRVGDAVAIDPTTERSASTALTRAG